MKNLYRRYKISQLLDEPLSNEEKEIIEFIIDKIKDLTLFIDDIGRHNYMNSKGEYIFNQNEKNDRLWVRYNDFWEVLKNKYLLEYDDIQAIIKSMVETTYKMSVGTPLNEMYERCRWVETTYKNGHIKYTLNL
jgi:hypothetical protein